LVIANKGSLVTYPEEFEAHDKRGFILVGGSGKPQTVAEVFFPRLHSSCGVGFHTGDFTIAEINKFLSQLKLNAVEARAHPTTTTAP
jgi:hypothetical protein